MDTKIWAHRGSSKEHIENTMEAFNQAIMDGADGIELDVQRTKDGKLVVVHDECLERLTGHRAFVWDLTWAQIQKLDLVWTRPDQGQYSNKKGKIPLLDQVLDLVKASRIDLNIELKNSINTYPGMEEEIIGLVEKFNIQDRVLYSSFNHKSVRLISDVLGPEFCGLLTSDLLYKPLDYLKEVGAGAFHPMVNSLQDIGLFKNCHNHNINVHVWTVNEDPLINACLLMGADALITDVPKKAIELKKQFIEDSGSQALESVKSLGLIDWGQSDE